MPENKVTFLTGTSQEYMNQKLAGNIDPNTLYFCSDTKQIFKGEDMYSFGLLDEMAEIKDWGMIQKIVQAGLAQAFFKVGDIFTCDSQFGEIEWRVIGFDHDKVDPEDADEHTMTLEMVRTTDYEAVYADPIAYARVDNHTLSDGSVVTTEQIYKGETETIPDISSANENEVWKYTGEQTTIEVDYEGKGETTQLTINTNDIITRSTQTSSYWAKVTHYSLLGSKGEYTIESYRIASDVDATQDFKFLINGADLLYDQSLRSNHYVMLVKIDKPLYTGCRLGYYANKDMCVVTGKFDRTFLIKYVTQNSIYSEQTVDTLPAQPESGDAKLWYQTSNNHVYKPEWGQDPDTQEQIFVQWIDEGEYDWPPTSPIANRGNIDYVKSNVRKLLNSKDEAAFTADTWEPDADYLGFDRLPAYEGKGFMYQLDPDFVKVLVAPKKKCFDGSKSDYTAYLKVDIDDQDKGLDIHIDKYLVDYATCNNPELTDSDFWVNPFGGKQPMIVGDLPPEMGPSMTLQDVADMIDAGQFPEEYHLDKHPCIMYVTSTPTQPLVLPNGLEVSKFYSYPIDEEGLMVLHFAQLIYYPQSGVDTIYNFFPVELINEASMLPQDKMTALQEYQDKIFLLGNAEVRSWGSADEGAAYEYYSKHIVEPTIMSTIYRVKIGVDKPDDEDEGNDYWLRSVSWAYRNYVARVYSDGDADGGGSPRYYYYLAPACVIG